MPSTHTSNVLIAGGGVIGLAIARELHKRGAGRIAVLDRGRVGGEASWAAAGMLAPNAECNESDDFHRLCTKSLELYPEFAAELREETGIDIELDRSGTLYVALTEEDSHEIQARFRWQSNAGMDVRHFSAEETLAAESGVSAKVRESLFFPNDWQVENRKLVDSLRAYCLANGIEIFEHTCVRELLRENGRIIGAAAEDRKFFAGQTVIACGAWTSQLAMDRLTLPFSVKPIRGQMLCYKSESRGFRHVIYSPRGYLVPRADGRVLAGSTAEDVGFDRSVTDAGIDKIRCEAARIAPSLELEDPVDKWAGLRPFVPPDGLPVIGELPGFRNAFAAAGHYRNGILLTPITAKIVAAKMLEGAESEYLRLFGPSRFLNSTAGTV